MYDMIDDADLAGQPGLVEMIHDFQEGMNNTDRFIAIVKSLETKEETFQAMKTELSSKAIVLASEKEAVSQDDVEVLKWIDDLTEIYIGIDNLKRNICCG